jgi:hypothetical protein
MVARFPDKENLWPRFVVTSFNVPSKQRCSMSAHRQKPIDFAKVGSSSPPIGFIFPCTSRESYMPPTRGFDSGTVKLLSRAVVQVAAETNSSNLPKTATLWRCPNDYCQ